MKKHLALLVFIPLIACQSQNEPSVSYPENPVITKLATAIQLGNDGAEINEFDYLGKPADSVKYPEGVRVSLPDTLGFSYVEPEKNLPMESVITLYSGGFGYDIIMHRSRRMEVEISVPADMFDSAPTLFGTFNAWNRTADTMVLKGDSWTAVLELEPGIHEYKLFHNETEYENPTADRVSNGMGGFNSIIEVKPKGEMPVELQTAGDLEEGVINLENNLGPDQKLIVLWENYRLPEESISYEEEKIAVNIPVAAKTAGRSTLRFFSANEAGWTRELRVPLLDGKPIMDAAKLDRGDWNSARMYFMMVDRFANGDSTNDDPINSREVLPQADFRGGDIAGILQKLREGYFDQLGVNTIWLSPITRGPRDAWGLWNKGGVTTKFSAYHGYWPTSNTLIDSHFGNPELVHQLLDEAHAKGYNVVLDYVANHIHQNHPLYEQHPDWATSLYLPDGSLNTERWDDHRLTTWFDNHLPTLDLRKWEVVDPMTDSAITWVTDYDFDGFRHDATKHIDLLFWRTLTKKVKHRVTDVTGKEIYQIGETYGSPELIASYLSTGMLDAQFDFNAYDAIVGVLTDSAIPIERIVDVMNNSWNYYGQHNTMGYISGNQDRSRFISIASGDVSLSEDQKLAGYTRHIGKPSKEGYEKLALLQVFNHSIPGIPVIYYGDEYGSPGANDPDNRRLMKFDDLDADEVRLREWVSELERLRSSEMALVYGTAEIEAMDDRVIHITRRYLNTQIDIYINRSKEPIDLPSIPSNAITLFGSRSIDGQLGGTSALILKTIAP
ncbi:alpha-amylase family glycosyl hydrolase [Phaeocystidibacter marisrubri]|uniref:Alpha-amylase n=1 Tax=Phaeocystidibacter marisrubri TaxID=1577780 RepID=A0A6L3ZCB1_9FLAO|nr:alpha-amylase family glycosyl hydrolase [Phaeocystidibacter marisrubri]KAB2815077.1 alpha-amylase [Phaeocystidibacter marisrubri]GGH70177.1 hypothetical protein GCM10011318_11960 [Phaeocystidibacter marisrubri]